MDGKYRQLFVSKLLLTTIVFLASGLSKIENRQKDLGCRIQ